MYLVAEAVQFAIWKDKVKGEWRKRTHLGKNRRDQDKRREWKGERSSAIPHVSGAFVDYGNVFISNGCERLLFHV